MGRKIGRDHSEACPAQSGCNVAPCRPVPRKAMKQHNNACVFGADIGIGNAAICKVNEVHISTCWRIARGCQNIFFLHTTSAARA
ncbi:hypothetical protein D3C79_1015260 [compost metagenome]